MDKMFGFEYVQGYTAALQDVLDIISSDGFELDLKRHKRNHSQKTYKALLECMLQNRAILREEPDAFIRCNNDVPGGFECYIEKQGVYHPSQS